MAYMVTRALRVENCGVNCALITNTRVLLECKKCGAIGNTGFKGIINVVYLVTEIY